jgi:hypothetical protein
MLKVCTSYSKKVPAGEQYSSQQFHASVEIELSDALTPDQVEERIHQTFAMVRSTVENEINGGGTPAKKPAPAPRNNNNGNGHTPAARRNHANGGPKASNAQVKYITDLASEQSVTLAALNTYVQSTYQVESMYELSKKEASELVDGLKRGRIKIPA